ncbi:carboxypeptidase-like regulatory domain-containing protein [Clostridium nigeriense]|uniref:carboxypeptidase-like regulatory domain-containing protein n=1 Tax=Clostridium nigeriense TaxID=1805470 RepID=UPI003D3403ED
MGTITGKITNKFREPIENALVGLKDKDFQDICVTYTNAEGNYRLDVENRVYPYLYAVKDYGIENLEFWCQDINLQNDIEINASIDKLELYGLKVFKVDGGYPALMVYFRPMSLVKYLNKESDISPNVDTIKVKINNENCEIYIVNEVEEFGGNGSSMRASLVHVSLNKEKLKESDNYLEVEIVDCDGNLGQAATYFTLNK